jgi:hypothetical protein
LPFGTPSGLPFGTPPEPTCGLVFGPVSGSIFGSVFGPIFGPVFGPYRDPQGHSPWNPHSRPNGIQNLCQQVKTTVAFSICKGVTHGRHGWTSAGCSGGRSEQRIGWWFACRSVCRTTIRTACCLGWWSGRCSELCFGFSARLRRRGIGMSRPSLSRGELRHQATSQRSRSLFGRLYSISGVIAGA